MTITKGVRLTRAQIAARWRARNAHRMKDLHRKHALSSNYGITPEEYDAILNKQGGVCAVCKNAETALMRNGEVKPLSVDHCHATNFIRGLLCDRCNFGIGLFQDNVNNLRAAAMYLEIANTGFKGRTEAYAALAESLIAQMIEESKAE